MVLVLDTETRQGHLGLGTMSVQNPISVHGECWETLVRHGEQTDSKKRHHWKALKDTSLRFTIAGFGGWTINYRWKRQTVLCTIRNCFAASAYWVPTALSPQLWQSIYRCCQVPGRMRTPHWLTNPGWEQLTGSSHQRKLLLRTENGSSALSWGFFQRQMRTVSGCRADWRDKEDFGGSQNARIHNYVHAITFTTPSQEKDFLWTVSMRCHSFCFSETSKHY